MLVIAPNCPLEPTNVRYGAMAHMSRRSLCINRPMQCVLCRDTDWLHGMAHHFDAKHAGSAPPNALSVKAEENKMVMNWSGKKNHNKRSHHDMDAGDGGDMAQPPPPPVPPQHRPYPPRRTSNRRRRRRPPPPPCSPPPPCAPPPPRDLC